MKIIIVSLIVMLGIAVAVPAKNIAESTDSVAEMIPGQSRSALREIVRTAVRHFLNFRKETPLSGEQKTAIGKIMSEHRAEMQTQFAKGRDARRSMFAAAKENADSPATKAAADKIGEMARDRALLAARIGAEVRPLLTAEQQKRIESAREEIETLVDTAVAAAGR